MHKAIRILAAVIVILTVGISMCLFAWFGVYNPTLVGAILLVCVVVISWSRFLDERANVKRPRRDHTNQYAVLGALDEKGPMTALELMQTLGWGSWKSGRIYVVLRQLENAKKVTCEWVTEDGRNKRVYKIARPGIIPYGAKLN